MRLQARAVIRELMRAVIKVGDAVTAKRRGSGGGGRRWGWTSPQQAWWGFRQQPGSRLQASLPWKWGPPGTPMSHDPSADKTG